MAVRPVLLYPDPVLKQVSAPAEPSSPAAAALLDDLVDTMRAYPGCVGLAAPQIGDLVRALVIDVSGSPRTKEHHGLVLLVNPVVVEASQWKLGREGCLSFPQLYANVKRAHKLHVQGFGRGGAALDLHAVGFEALALQHEIDHLDGILFLDRIRSSKDLFERRPS